MTCRCNRNRNKKQARMSCINGVEPKFQIFFSFALIIKRYKTTIFLGFNVKWCVPRIAAYCGWMDKFWHGMMATVETGETGVPSNGKTWDWTIYSLVFLFVGWIDDHPVADFDVTVIGQRWTQFVHDSRHFETCSYTPLIACTRNTDHNATVRIQDSIVPDLYVRYM